MRELFTVHGPHGPLEKNVGQGTLQTLTARRTNALEILPMEGALLRANKDRHNTASKSSLPDHLLIFRTKVILNRLPTRQERHRRGDTHADGTHVEATCPNCVHPIEDHLHAIADCPHLLHHAAQLAYDINNTIRTTSSTLFKKATRDAAWLQKQLQTMHEHTFVLKAGWRTTYTDKHGRTTVTSTGPDRVGSHKGRDTLHPTLFRSRTRNKQLNIDNVRTALADKPGTTVDVHLLRLITKHIPTQLLLSEVAGHPACARADKLTDIMYIVPPEAQHRYCIWDAHTIHVTDHPTYADAIARHLQYNTAPLLIISLDTTITGMKQQVTIDTDTIQVNTGKFWQGNQKGSSRTTNTETLYIHMSPACTPQEIRTISLITRLRHVSKYAHEQQDIQHPVFDNPHPLQKGNASQNHRTNEPRRSPKLHFHITLTHGQ